MSALPLATIRRDPTVSVVMPIRNEADFIARSLGAVLPRTTRPTASK